MSKIKYYPTPEQAMTIVQENITANFLLDTLYNIPYVYPCSKEAHFEFEMLGMSAIGSNISSNSYNDINELLEIWDSSTLNQFNIFFLKHKGRPLYE